jgi:hypothetical protein
MYWVTNWNMLLRLDVHHCVNIDDSAMTKNCQQSRMLCLHLCKACTPVFICSEKCFTCCANYVSPHLPVTFYLTHICIMEHGSEQPHVSPTCRLFIFCHLKGPRGKLHFIDMKQSTWKFDFLPNEVGSIVLAAQCVKQIADKGRQVSMLQTTQPRSFLLISRSSMPKDVRM